MQKTLEVKKSVNIAILDMKEVSGITDYFVICTGQNPPHIKALVREVQRALISHSIRAYRSAGKPESGWMIEDYVDVVLHVFSPEMREFYSLEQLWSDATNIA